MEKIIMRTTLLFAVILGGSFGCSQDSSSLDSDLFISGTDKNTQASQNTGNDDQNDENNNAPMEQDAADSIWLVDFEPSQFAMGMPFGDEQFTPDQMPHEVTLSHSWSISETEVTYAQWLQFMDYDPRDLWLGGDLAFELIGDNFPVGAISWYEASAYANKLSQDQGYEECYTCEGEGVDIYCEPAMNPYDCEGYRLPTEAEWEYAAKGGEEYMYPGSDNIEDIGWWEENSGYQSHEVATKDANGFGLYDMGGNIREFVYDWYLPYSNEAVTDPVVYQDEADQPAERGGSFACRPEELRWNRRHKAFEYVRDAHTGFRLVRIID
jgi:formylglycine-generating enzyme required for sulfatase activity